MLKTKPMTDIETIKIEILPKTKVFFDSIETQFSYREKHYSKYRILNSVTGFILFIFIINIIPIVPYFSGEQKWLTDKQIAINNLTIPLDNFFIRWIVFVLLSGLVYIIFRPIDKAFDKREDKFSINGKHLNFAYLYKSIRELEIFMVNDRKEHTIISLSNLKQYVDRSFLNYFVTIADKSEQVFLPETLLDLQNKFSWIIYQDSTKAIISAFNDFENKIFERIAQRKEIDLVIEILKDLLACEYILLDKVKVEKLPTNINDNKVASNLFIESSASKINIMDKVEIEIDETRYISTLDRLNNIANFFTNLFTHQNLLITFFSWFILLGLLLIALLYLGNNLYDLVIDSTIFIGAISAVLVGAITISATIYSKRK